ncbi:hypothetical protein [Bacillus sp. ISL-7]|nr:hypothetical protein [Bacillus sp. ISL-7]
MSNLHVHRETGNFYSIITGKRIAVRTANHLVIDGKSEDIHCHL